MSITYCSQCEQVVEGDTLDFECPECGATHTICRHCSQAETVELPEDDPRRDR